MYATYAARTRNWLTQIRRQEPCDIYKPAKNEVRGSGGVGLLVKERLYDKFNINVWDSSYEGILWVRFEQQENSQVIFLICVCYLPPSSSSRGDTSQEFFETLGNQYLLYSNCGLVCIFGDFNAQCGSCQDIPDSDTFIPQRWILDSSMNSHGTIRLPKTPGSLHA